MGSMPVDMHLIAKSTIEDYAAAHAKARIPLQNWISIVQAARWTSMDQLVRLGIFNVSPIGNDRIVFNIGGNNYRLICSIRFARPACADSPATAGVVYVKWFGTHAEYDQIDASTVAFRK